MSRLVCHSLTDAVLQPLEILVEESLLLYNHTCEHTRQGLGR